MSAPAILRCTNCHRPIEACACCDELDCPPPICNGCLTVAVIMSIRPEYVHRGASVIPEAGERAGNQTP